MAASRHADRTGQELQICNAWSELLPTLGNHHSAGHWRQAAWACHAGASARDQTPVTPAASTSVAPGGSCAAAPPADELGVDGAPPPGLQIARHTRRHQTATPRPRHMSVQRDRRAMIKRRRPMRARPGGSAADTAREISTGRPADGRLGVEPPPVARQPLGRLPTLRRWRTEQTHRPTDISCICNDSEPLGGPGPIPALPPQSGRIDALRPPQTPLRRPRRATPPRQPLGVDTRRQTWSSELWNQKAGSRAGKILG